MSCVAPRAPCSVVGEPCPTIPDVRQADGAGTMCVQHDLTLISKFMYTCICGCVHEIKSIIISKYFCHIHYSILFLFQIIHS